MNGTTDPSKPLPWDEDAERCLLGSILLNPSALFEVAGEVGPESFWKVSHQRIFATMERMMGDGKPTNLMTVTQELGRAGQLEEAGGALYLTKLLDAVPTAANLGYYKDIVVKLHRARLGIETLEERCKRLYAVKGGEDVDPPALLEESAEHIRQRTGNTGPLVRSLADLQPPDGSEELLKHRFLCRGGGALFYGPAGVGKSSCDMQCSILWTLGRPAFGIYPARPLRIVQVQAENDDGDLWEMCNGVMRGLRLSPEEQKAALKNIFFKTEDRYTGPEFCNKVVRPILHFQKPDLLKIDPALAYLGGDTGSQKDVGSFLRNGLNPLLHRYRCGCIIVHHTNKPPSGKEKPEWKGGDFAYLGSGSAEWANWPRAVIGLRSIGRNDVYELRLGKRGSRVGWKGADGVTPAYAKLIGHSKEPGVICWRELDEVEAAEVMAETGKQSVAEKRRQQMLDALDKPMAVSEFQKYCESELGISKGAFYRHWLHVRKSLTLDKLSGRYHKESCGPVSPKTRHE